MSEIALSAGAPHRSSTFKVLAAASIGNALEWYDILAYGYFAVTISKLFFPTADPTTALLLTFGTFGVSYLVRPLGALVLGAYADRAGRRAAMLTKGSAAIDGRSAVADSVLFSVESLFAAWAN